MRPICASLLVVSLWSVSPQMQQQQRSPLAFYIVPVGLIAPYYVPDPADGARLLFAGESLDFKVQVRHEGGPSTALFAAGDRAGISVLVRSESGSVPAQVLGLSQSPRREFRGSSQPEPWTRRIPLSEGESVTWDSRFETRLTTAPGVYDLRGNISDRDDNGRPVRERVPSIRIEVRAPNSESRQELMMRRALRLYLDDRYSEAEVALTEMIGAFPSSAMAYTALGETLAKLSRPAEALQAFRLALKILEGGADEALIQSRPPSSIVEAITAARRRVSSATLPR